MADYTETHTRDTARFTVATEYESIAVECESDCGEVSLEVTASDGTTVCAWLSPRQLAAVQQALDSAKNCIGKCASLSRPKESTDG